MLIDRACARSITPCDGISQQQQQQPTWNIPGRKRVTVFTETNLSVKDVCSEGFAETNKVKK